MSACSRGSARPICSRRLRICCCRRWPGWRRSETVGPAPRRDTKKHETGIFSCSFVSLRGFATYALGGVSNELRVLGRPKRNIIFPVSRQLICAEAERERRAKRRFIEAELDHIRVVARPRAARGDWLRHAVDDRGSAFQPGAIAHCDLMR